MGSIPDAGDHFPHQVAGHGQLWINGDGHLIKATNTREVTFYESLATHCPLLLPFIPEYYGTIEIEGVPHIKLANMTLGNTAPWVLDVKMGIQQHAPDAPLIKIQSSQRKCKQSTSLVYGIRLCGAQLEKRWEKASLLSMDHDTMVDMFRAFWRPCMHLVPAFIEWIKNLQVAHHQTPHVRLYSSSLLIILNPSQQVFKGAMIDFAHAYLTNDTEPDPGYMLGLQTLLDIHMALK